MFSFYILASIVLDATATSTNAATGSIASGSACPNAGASTVAAPNGYQRWSKFEGQTKDLVQESNPRAAAIIEVTKFLQEPLLERNGNPLQWWSQRKIYYPRLYQLAMARLCVMATSMPSERIFSKAGQLITDRRCRLAGGKVKQIMFLHYNIDI